MREYTIYLVTGLSISAALYGVFLSQVIMYHRTYSNDKARIRLMVYFILLTETVMLLFDVTMIGLKSGADKDSFDLEPMLSGNTVLTGLISTTVQLYLCGRIRIFSNTRIFPGVIALCSVGSLAMGLTIGIRRTPRLDISTSTRQLGEPPEAFGLIMTWLVLSAAADLAITIGLSLALHRRRKEVLLSSTNNVLNKIVLSTVETGLITSVCAILDAVSHASHSPVQVLYVPDLILPRLYSNSLLAILNARSRFSKMLDADATRQDSVSPMAFELGEGCRRSDGTVYTHPP